MNSNLKQPPEGSPESSDSSPNPVDKTGQDSEKHLPHPDNRQVEVTVDGEVRSLDKGKYTGIDLKECLRIASDLEVDQVVEGTFLPLDDNTRLVSSTCQPSRSSASLATAMALDSMTLLWPAVRTGAKPPLLLGFPSSS